MSLDADRLHASFALVAERNPDLTLQFYDLLFERYPQAEPLFADTTRQAQGKMLAEALTAVLENLDNAPWLQETLSGLGAKHERYGVTREMYPWVGECLIATMADVAGDDWDKPTEQAWVDAYGAICDLMWTGYADA